MNKSIFGQVFDSELRNLRFSHTGRAKDHYWNVPVGINFDEKVVYSHRLVTDDNSRSLFKDTNLYKIGSMCLDTFHILLQSLEGF